MSRTDLWREFSRHSPVVSVSVVSAHDPQGRETAMAHRRRDADISCYMCDVPTRNPVAIALFQGQDARAPTLSSGVCRKCLVTHGDGLLEVVSLRFENLFPGCRRVTIQKESGNA